MRLALAQINSVVGDIDGNVQRITAWLERARDANADLVLFPELAVTGYPPEDLLLREGFLTDARKAVERLAAETEGIVALVGMAEPVCPDLARALGTRLAISASVNASAARSCGNIQADNTMANNASAPSSSNISSVSGVAVSVTAAAAPRLPANKLRKKKK